MLMANSIVALPPFAAEEHLCCANEGSAGDHGWKELIALSSYNQVRKWSHRKNLNLLSRQFSPRQNAHKSNTVFWTLHWSCDIWSRGDSHDPLHFSQDVQTCSLRCNFHIYAYFKCSILPLVWHVCLRKCENTKDSWTDCSRRLRSLHAAGNIWEQRAHFSLHNHGWATWRCWRSSPTSSTGCQTAPTVRWQ